MTTFDQVLQLARELPVTEQVRLRAALKDSETAAHEEQIARNQAAIALLETWSGTTEDDDGTESWDEMLQSLDRESARKLFSDLHANAAERS